MLGRWVAGSRAWLDVAVVATLALIALGAVSLGGFALLSTSREALVSDLSSIMRGRVDSEKFRSVLWRTLADDPNAVAQFRVRYEIFVSRVTEAEDILINLTKENLAQEQRLVADRAELRAHIRAFDAVMRRPDLSEKQRAARIAPRLDAALRIFERIERAAIRNSRDLRIQRHREAYAVAVANILIAIATIAALLWLWWVSRRARRALETQDARRRRFLAHLSHEFRTPLNAIQGFADLILLNFDAVDDDKKKEYLGDIRDSAVSLDEMTRAALNLSRVEDGGVDLVDRTTPLPDLIAGARKLIALRAEERGIAIDLDIDPKAEIFGDRDHLTRALTNLMSNALKYSAPDTRVTIRARDGEISVADQGCGIPASEIDLVWSPYRRSSLTRGDGQGFGLGLPYARAVMRLHGGDTSLESVEGEGTTVRLIFPPARWRAQSPADHAAAAADASAA